ncbi:MAG: SDR family NAD(P)-dependent oxidoreductase, partial [Burkholderiales bacterium]
MNQLDFKNRTAIVTGGAQGIGLAIARRLVASGANVRVWDRDEKLLAKSVASLGATAAGDAVDVTDRSAVERAAISALEAFGRIDVLVNNAGIAGMTAPVTEYPIEEWKRVIDIDLTGPFLCCRAVVPHMVKSGYGRIVNIASIAGKEGNPNAAAYAAAKGG